MIAPEVLSRIKEIEIFTRRLVSSAHVGGTTSTYKGSGLEFDQIREYHVGDDVRFIDWHSTARANRVLIKQYMEERNRIIILAVDCSSSTFFGSNVRLKYDSMAEIAGVLALVANYAKDQVGLLLFSDTVECYIPPSKGHQHSRLILEKLFSVKPRSVKTNLRVGLDHVAAQKKRNALVFLISDFIDQQDYEKQLGHITSLYDVIAIRVTDAMETALPAVGFLTIEDKETKTRHCIDLRARKEPMVRDFLHAMNKEIEQRCVRYGIDYLEIQPELSSITSLVRLLRRRMHY